MRRRRPLLPSGLGEIVTDQLQQNAIARMAGFDNMDRVMRDLINATRTINKASKAYRNGIRTFEQAERWLAGLSFETGGAEEVAIEAPADRLYRRPRRRPSQETGS